MTTYYAYDKSHRMTTQYQLGGEAHYFTYNERDMITQIQDWNGAGDVNRYFTYNGVGERTVMRDSASNLSYMTYDGSKLLTEKTETGAVYGRYRHNLSPLDRAGSGLEFTISDGTHRNVFNPVFGHDGSTRYAFANEAAYVSYVYDAVGRQLLAPGGVASGTGVPTTSRLQGLTGLGFQQLTTTEQLYTVGSALFIPGLALFGIDRWPGGPFVEVGRKLSASWIAALIAWLQGGGAVLVQDPPSGEEGGGAGSGCPTTADPYAQAWWECTLELPGGKLAGTASDRGVPAPGEVGPIAMFDRAANQNRKPLKSYAGAYHKTCKKCDSFTKVALDNAFDRINAEGFNYHVTGPNSNTFAGFLWRRACGDPLTGDLPVGLHYGTTLDDHWVKVIDPNTGQTIYESPHELRSCEGGK